MNIPKPDFKILKNKEQNDELIKNGYIVLPILDDDEVSFFKKLYKKWHPKPPEEFYKSYFSQNKEYKHEVEDAVISHFNPKLKKYFEDNTTCGGMFVVKPKGEKGHLNPHQDWSLVDETKNWSLNAWCPLINAEGENGNMQMLPGSHFFMKSERGGGTPLLYDHLCDVITPNLVDIPMKAGEAVFFFHGIVHCSTDNTKNEERVCVGMSLIQKDAQLYYFSLRENETQLNKFKVDSDFYINFVSNQDMLFEKAEYIGKSNTPISMFTKDELLEQIQKFITEVKLSYS